MLALVATIAGSVITGYSAYKIHTIRRGQDRKLRDMEVLRRLNISSKKQVRVWSLLMALGLVLLTPGLGYLLCCDQISGNGSDAPYLDLKSNPSGNPAIVPPSEKLDKTPRTVEDDESGSSGQPLIFVGSSGGGGSSRRSSSGGSSTASEPSSSEYVTGTGERLTEGYDNDTIPSDSSGSIPEASEANETEESSETKLDSSSREIEAPFESTANTTGSDHVKEETEPAPTKNLTLPAEIETATEETSAEGALEISEAVDEIGPDQTKDVLESTPTEISAETEVIDVLPEEIAIPYTPGYAEDVLESTPAETSAETEVIDILPEKITDPDTVGLSEMVDESESPSLAPSSEPYDFKLEQDLPKTSAAPPVSDEDNKIDLTWLTPAIESPATSSVSNLPAAPDEIKKLVFKGDSEPVTIATVNSSGDDGEPADDLIQNLGGTSSNLTTGTTTDAFEGESDFNSKFQDFASKTQTEMGTDKNGTPNSVTIMEFETLDFKSNFRSGSGLTPSSPFG